MDNSNMSDNNEDKHMYEAMASAICEDIVCIVEVDNDKKIYNVRKSNEYFDKMLKKEGTLRELYCSMFSGCRRDAEDNYTNNYSRFIDESVFRKDKYHGSVHFDMNGVESSYYFRFAKISEDKSVVAFFSVSYSQSNLLELEKIDTIQESYLFSMMVNLANDSCMNPSTTETNAVKQDYMDIKYSEWRLMIANMFKDEDKVLFLRASSPENILNTLELQNNFHIDLQMMNMQGKFVWCRLKFARMKNFSRENPRFVYTVSDISDDIAQLIQQEGMIKAIEEQNERLKEADNKKSRFVSSMSHEIRAPINAIVGLNEVILRDCKDEIIRGYAKDIKAASQYLLSLVNDILDYSKIEAGKMEIVPVEYNMRDLIIGVCNIVRPKLVGKNIEFEMKLGEDVPKRLFGDEIRISQILINLLVNSVKYTNEGKVSFYVEKVADLNGQVAIKFSVHDTGVGIKQEDMATFFEEYGRIDLIKNRNTEGTGLGMSIVQGLLAQMKSQLIVESVYGKGSTFSFVLLQKVVNEKEVQDADNEKEDEGKGNQENAIREIPDRNILVVDDSAINLHVVEALMAPYKANVECVNGGRKAIEMMKQKKYDIVFIDHMMPEMDGIETLNELRRIDNYYNKVPVVALTGNYSPTAREEYVSLGFTDYLEKPILLEALNTIINKYV